MDTCEEFSPTFLYVKQHSVTGKLYFGKTIGDPVKYLGSGTDWQRHIKEHGKQHVVTLWYCLFMEKDEVLEFAKMCSLRWDIVNSDQWLNLLGENGLHGGSVKGRPSPNKGKPGATKGMKHGKRNTVSPAKGRKMDKPSPLIGRETGRPVWNKGMKMTTPSPKKGLPSPNKGMKYKTRCPKVRVVMHHNRKEINMSNTLINTQPVDECFI